ncbi:MAG: hypothetical protein ACO3PB_06615 [Miltoncostaeaceae bacterium]
MVLRQLRSLWRKLLRLERPRQPPGIWRSRDTASVLLVCALVALVASWPWLVEPNLRPGMSAPFTARAPKAARVVDSTALEERRQEMVPRTTVQVVDQQTNQLLQQQLEKGLQAVEQQANAEQPRVEPVAITAEERAWLKTVGPAELTAWGREVRQAQLRMLSQGVAPGVAEGQLLQAATLQLEPLASVPRGLGARLLTNALQGHSNLRSDPGLSQRRIEALITQQGIPTIVVEQGDLITRQGETISPQSLDVLDYFGLVNRRPRPLTWLGHFLEALAVAGVLVLVLRRWRACLEPRQALLGLGARLGLPGCTWGLGPRGGPRGPTQPASSLALRRTSSTSPA